MGLGNEEDACCDVDMMMMVFVCAFARQMMKANGFLK